MTPASAGTTAADAGGERVTGDAPASAGTTAVSRLGGARSGDDPRERGDDSRDLRLWEVGVG